MAVSGELGTREHNGKTYITCKVNDVTLVGGKPQQQGQQQQQPQAWGQQQQPAQQQPAQQFANQQPVKDQDIPF